MTITTTSLQVMTITTTSLQVMTKLLSVIVNAIIYSIKSHLQLQMLFDLFSVTAISTIRVKSPL